jgi:arylsulfatase A-like enzyme
MKVGQVIGVTDRYAGAVTSRPVHYQDVFATLYANLGIDPATTTVTDPNGRPQHLLDQGEPIRELV